MTRRYIPPGAKLVPNQARCVFEGVLYSVWQWQQEVFDGTYETFEMLRRCDTAQIIALVDDKVLIQEEEQPHAGKFVDVPGGMHDREGEDELQCAKRELREETGYIFNNWKLVYCAQNQGKIEKFDYVFVAYGGYRVVAAKNDNGERITPKFLDFREFKDILPRLRSRNNIRSAIAGYSSLSAVAELENLYDK